MFKFLFFMLCFKTFIHELFGNPSCPSGTTPSKYDSNVCFSFGKVPKTFDDAEAACVNAGGHLAPIFDQFTNNEVEDLADDAFRNFTDFWIGAQLTNVNSALIWLWKWHDSIMKYNDWAPGEPSDNKKCVSVSLAKAWWTSNDCNLTKPYVCRMPSQVIVCEEGWTFLEKTKMCYKMFASDSGFNFSTAQRLCRTQNANAVSIHSDAENTMVGKLTTLKRGFNSFTVAVWIGLAYSNGAWNWTDGTTFDYQAWGDHDPDNVGTSNCVNFYPDGAGDAGYNNYIMKWDTSTCTDKFLRVVCKKYPNIVPISEKP